MIKKVGSQWILYTKDGKKILGKHKTRAKAIAQEWAIKKSKERRK
jgi:hypothetical protein